MILDKEEHRSFLLNALAAASVQGRLPELREFVKVAEELETAIKNAAILAPLAADNLHP